MKALIEEMRGGKRGEKEEGGELKEKKKDKHGTGCGQEAGWSTEAPT